MVKREKCLLHKIKLAQRLIALATFQLPNLNLGKRTRNRQGLTELTESRLNEIKTSFRVAKKFHLDQLNAPFNTGLFCFARVTQINMSLLIL